MADANSDVESIPMGDEEDSVSCAQFKAFKEYLQHNEWPKWPSTRAEMKPEHCGCGNYGSLLNPFGPKDFWHLVMTWWLGQFLVPREPHAAAGHSGGQKSRSPTAVQ